VSLARHDRHRQPVVGSSATKFPRGFQCGRRRVGPRATPSPSLFASTPPASLTPGVDCGKPRHCVTPWGPSAPWPPLLSAFSGTEHRADPVRASGLSKVDPAVAGAHAAALAAGPGHPLSYPCARVRLVDGHRSCCASLFKKFASTKLLTPSCTSTSGRQASDGEPHLLVGARLVRPETLRRRQCQTGDHHVDRDERRWDVGGTWHIYAWRVPGRSGCYQRGRGRGCHRRSLRAVTGTGKVTAFPGRRLHGSARSQKRPGVQVTFSGEFVSWSPPTRTRQARASLRVWHAAADG
jgi:hypothetical protein